MRRLRLFMFLLLAASAIYAQDTIKSLVISEVRFDNGEMAYIELTNMGDATINLANFKIGNQESWWNPWEYAIEKWTWLPDVDLPSNESFVIASVYDFEPEQYLLDPLGVYRERVTKEELWALADMQVHVKEINSNENDSISFGQFMMDLEPGDAFFLEYNFEYDSSGVTLKDSAIVDQVGGVFDDENGQNYNTPYPVAGVENATQTTTLIRKSSVTEGNPVFVYGTDIADSEWLPIEHLHGNFEPWRALFWTVGNHGNYQLDNNTLTSSTLQVDAAAGTITVPWGIRRWDDIMSHMEKKPGVAWHYDLVANHADSAYSSAQTGDMLTVYVVGNELASKTFEIIVEEPTADDNIVIPKYPQNTDGTYALSEDQVSWVAGTITGGSVNMISSGDAARFRVSRGDPEMDKITRLPYALRVDSLFKYLEKAPDASWEIVWVDGTERADLKNGDKLKVSSAGGQVKEYELVLEDYLPAAEAYLSAITWPDMPPAYAPILEIMGWKGDTLPNFAQHINEYKIFVPPMINELPALIPTLKDKNASVQVSRAQGIFGTEEQRTTTFTVVAENGITRSEYKVIFEKVVQNVDAEPFISEYIWQEQFRNAFLEICNPGTTPLDLSKYMIAGLNKNPAVTISSTPSWFRRLDKYVPGYKWVDSTQWKVAPHTLVKDLNINPIVNPGDVFVASVILRTDGASGYPWFASEQADIDFAHDPWGENGEGEPFFSAVRPQGWNATNVYLFEIVGDSVLDGTKPATDPNDFRLLDFFGHGKNGWNPWVIGGKKLQFEINPGDVNAQNTSFVRRPHITTYNPDGTFGTDSATCEWDFYHQTYWEERGYVAPESEILVASDIGRHTFESITNYKSTVTSIVYKVSGGASSTETIKGVVTGTSATDFLGNIDKADEAQALTLSRTSDGSEFSGDMLVLNGDSLVVLSADSSNTSKYIIEVTDEGLSDDALLTSTVYTISVDGTSGSISGLDYGTAISDMLAGINVPVAAKMTVINENGAYVAMQRLNIDGAYVPTEVSNQIYLEVIAEDNVTKVVYQIQPNADASSAFVTSDVYEVNQDLIEIRGIAQHSTVSTLLSNLVPSPGASIMVVDKEGAQRTAGLIVKDDKLLVTSGDGTASASYFLYINDVIYNFQAYVVSSEYIVDQDELTISGEDVTGAISVSAFMANLLAAPGASMMVMDAGGNVKGNDDMLSDDDEVVVTSGNGENMETYIVVLSHTGTNSSNAAMVKVYPNPSKGLLHVSGADLGSRIRVFNTTGAVICDQLVSGSVETLSLEDHPAGMYFVTISNEEVATGHYKVVKH